MAGRERCWFMLRKSFSVYLTLFFFLNEAIPLQPLGHSLDIGWLWSQVSPYPESQTGLGWKRLGR